MSRLQKMPYQKDCEIVVCAGCIRRCGASENPIDFATQTLTELQNQYPSVNWKLKTNSCLRLCPENKISITVNRRLSMSRLPSSQSIINEIISLLFPPK